MRAVVYERAGPAREVLKIATVADPVAGPGEVRVKLQWSGINPSDVKTRAGMRPKSHSFHQVVPHSDGMGVIDRVGDGVAPSRVGERVWIWNGAWGRQFGTAAQYIALPAEQAVPLPDSVNGDEAACFGIPALTALHATLVAGGVAGKSVLVAGGAGAVGHYAVQFAKLLGAKNVIATVSSQAKAELAKAAGADAVVNYRTADLAREVLEITGGAGIDRVLEVDISTNARAAVEYTARGGEWIVYGSGAPEFQLPFFPLISRNIDVRFFMVYHLSHEDRANAIDQLQVLLGNGQLQHNIAHRIDFKDVAHAHELIEQGAAIGNVVLRIPDAGEGGE